MIVTSCFFLTVFRKQDRHIAEVFLKDCFVGAAKQTNLMASRRLPRQFCARIKLKSETWGRDNEKRLFVFVVLRCPFQEPQEEIAKCNHWK